MPRKPHDQAAIFTLNETGPLVYGSTVTFTATVPKLHANEYPMVVVRAYQGEDLVYAQLAHPTDVFVLGTGSRWSEIGGPADCEAVLYSYPSITQLAPAIEFHAG